MVRLTALAAVAALALAAPVAAELQPEQLTVERLAEAMQPHWVWVNDISFDRILDGRAYLIDADSGQMLGMVNGGFAHSVLLLSEDGKSLAVPGVFYSRGTRGERTDVLTFYKTGDLEPGAEIELPPKRYGGMPFPALAPVMPGGRHALIYNFTPEQSLSVVDMQAQSFVGEFLTPGCSLVYPTGPSRFFQICSDGSLQASTLDAEGKVVAGPATKALFPREDPVTEKGVWTGAHWLFFSQQSAKVHVIEHKAALPKVAKSWSLIGKGDEGWRPGGLQTAAYHRATDRLYVLMHEGGPDTHKDPGTEIWVYQASSGKRVQRIALDSPANSVAISQDDDPLLYTICFGDTAFTVRDPADGKVLRKVDGFGPTMTIIQPAPIAGR